MAINKNENESNGNIQLKFNIIYRLSFDENNPKIFTKIDEDFNKLKKFKKGDSANPGEGFYKINKDFQNKLTSQKSLDDYDIVNNILIKSFAREFYPKGLQIPHYEEADIFLMKNEKILVIRGSKRVCETADKYLRGFKNISLERINWDKNFLIWILYRFDQNRGKLLNNISCAKINKGRTKGSNSNEGDINSNRIQSRAIPLTIIYGLLNNNLIHHLGIILKFDNHYFNVKMDIDKPLQLYPNQALKGKNYVEKCKLTLPFISHLVSLFELWKNLDRSEKYPNDEFFKSLKKSFCRDVKDALEGFNTLNTKYANLRGDENG